MTIEDQVSCEVADGIVKVTLTGDFSQQKLSQAISFVADLVGPQDQAKVLVRRVDAPHSALRSYEHVYALQSEVLPGKARVAFLSRCPEDLDTMRLLVALIRQKHLLTAEVFTSEAKALAWLNEG